MASVFLLLALLLVGVGSIEAQQNFINEIDIFTSDCSDCGMPSFLGQLSVKVILHSNLRMNLVYIG